MISDHARCIEALGEYVRELASEGRVDAILESMDSLEELRQAILNEIKVGSLCHPFHPEVEGICVHCGRTDNLEFGPDPYRHDVHGDDTPMWECKACRHGSAMDI